MHKLLPILLFAYGLSLTTDEIYYNSYALIICIDKYQNVRSLDYAVKDAEDIQSMLVDKFHFKEDDIVLLKDEEATKASIIQEFSNITKQAGANDRIIIFFAGHGETEDLPDGGEMGYLLPVDGNKTDLYVSAIEMNAIQTMSLRSEAKHILYLIDACYGGIASVGARGLDAQSTPNYIQKITQYKSRQIISAGGRGEQVIEKAEWGHSAFTKNLLSGLRDWKADTDSDGIITAQELGIYLKKKVTIDSNNQQTPKTRNLTTDEGEFVFFQNEISTVNNNNVPNKDKINEPAIDNSTKNWEYIRDGSEYIITHRHGYGIGSDMDRFLNNGDKAISFGWELFHIYNMQHDWGWTNMTSISIKDYLTSYSDVFFLYGVGIDVYLFEMTDDMEGKFGFTPFIGFGTIGAKLIKRRMQGKVKIGYNVIFNGSNIDMESGITYTASIGIFRRKYSERNKILPE